MKSTINFFLNNTIAANLLMVFILILGLFGLSQLKTTFFPEQPSRIINITTIYPGASPEEMEEGVVTKIEENLIGIRGVERTSSTSSENSGIITVEVDRGFDADLVIQDVKNAVDQINSFPVGMEPPIIFKQEQLSQAFIFAISGEIDLRVLKQYAYQIEDDLLALDGISRLQLSGFPEEEIEITFRERDMRLLNITFDEAVRAVGGTNLLSTGGTIKTETEELLIRAKNKEYYAEEFQDIVVRSNSDGGLVRLSEIADVKDRWEDSPTRTYVNGESGIVITVFNTLEEDMFDNSETTQAYLDGFMDEHPFLELNVIQDGKDYLNERISFIKENGLIGFFLVLILLAMFLNGRMAFWVALAIPISFAGMFMVGSLLGITINVISTFGMVLVIGILVDDGIVIAENIYQRYEDGEPPMKAALEGTMEVLPAVSSAILTTVIAFCTFFFIEGGLGDVFGQLSIVVIFTLVFSLVEGAFILPAHIAHSKALRKDNSNRVSRFFDRIMYYMRDKIYGKVLRFSMNYSFPAVAICVAALIIIVGAFMGGIIRGTFFPFIPFDNFQVALELPSGTREYQVNEALDKIETAAWEVNQELSDEYFAGEKQVIEKIQRDVGPSTNVGNLVVYLLTGEERTEVSNYMITDAIRKKVGVIPNAEKLSFGTTTFFGDPVSISLLGSDPVELGRAVDDLKDELAGISGLRDIQDTDKEGLKEINLELKPKAYNLGFTLNEIIRYVRQGFFGAEIQRLQRGPDEVKVWVRYGLEDRSSISDLADMRIRTAAGQAIPLADLVNFETERGVININHIDGQREVRVTSDVANTRVSISDVNADIQDIILPRLLERYPSVRVGFEGQARENAKSQESMQRTVPIILLLMFFVVIMTFGSVSQAFVVFAILPFGFIGVGFGHWFMDQPISLFSVLGVIALIGILINDALVFVTSFNERIRTGKDFREALYETGLSRFRPILLTTITTVAGLMPLLLEKSVQAQFLIPMAISVAFGLMISTFVLLVLLPSLLVITNRVRRFSTQLWTGEKVTPVMVEPAYAGRQHPWLITLLAAIVTMALFALLVFASFKISELFF